MENADTLYKPSHFWQHGFEALKYDLDIHGIENFRCLLSALSYFVPTYTFNGLAADPQGFKDIVNVFENIGSKDPKAGMALEQFFSGKLQALSDYRVYLASDQNKIPHTLSFSESQIGNPVGQFCFDGKNYSRSSLNYLLGLNFFKQHIDNCRVNTVLEIGGGFGSLGEILLSDRRNDTFYIDVDIPPTCLFSSYYLKQVIGQEYVADTVQITASQNFSISRLRQDYRSVILCPWQLPRLTGQIDLFVNFISFQEMEPNIVRNYLSQVRRLECRYVLLRNLKEGKQVATDSSQLGVREPITGDDYNTFLPDYELITTNVIPYGYQTVDGFHSELRLYRLQ